MELKMPSFSKRSLESKSQCHEDLQLLLDTIIKYYDCSVICGYRNKEDQNAAYNAKPKRSKLKFPQSKHNKFPSLAVDVVPYPIDWDDKQRFRDFGNYAIGVADALYDIGMIKHRIRWGHDWDSDHDLTDQEFTDSPHFEIIEV
jgi:peptidoglycan L-alanyl-D-glutamate endopeptidase CwlK